MRNLTVAIHHLTRVEGHGNIVVDMEKGVLTRCELDVVETPRFFEAMLRGRAYEEAAHITSRICGICAVGHATTSLHATEKALGIVPSRQTTLLRKLNFYGEILDSHILHIYMLVAPDLLGAGSVIPLAKSAPEVVMRALRLKHLAGEICRMICGRHTHPIAMIPGGFAHYPTANELKALQAQLIAARPDVDATIALLQTLQFPQFERETEYVALHDDLEYCFMEGMIASTDGELLPIENYRQVTNEYLVPHSSAKHTHFHRESYMVGAMARFNVNYEQLHPKAKAAAVALGLQPNLTNPYLNSAAQAVEIVHALEDAIQIIDQLLTQGIHWEEPALPTRLSGEGTGACEVPRGTLFHHYCIEDGKVVSADCIIPTGQNLANVELDMRELVPTLLDRSQEEIALALEMLVRAYDPCISCSTHMLNVQFV